MTSVAYYLQHESLRRCIILHKIQRTKTTTRPTIIILCTKDIEFQYNINFTFQLKCEITSSAIDCMPSIASAICSPTDSISSSARAKNETDNNANNNFFINSPFKKINNLPVYSIHEMQVLSKSFHHPKLNLGFSIKYKQLIP